jgi:hypothetical protein
MYYYYFFKKIILYYCITIFLKKMTNYNGPGEYLGGRRKRRSMRGGVAYGAQDAQDVYLTGGRKRRSMRGGVLRIMSGMGDIAYE